MLKDALRFCFVQMLQGVFEAKEKLYTLKEAQIWINETTVYQ
jgi:hypothetical protein